MAKAERGDGASATEAAGVFVRGGASANVVRCVFDGNDRGVVVDINFDGTVQVRSCFFVNNGNDISESLQNMTREMWSKPVKVVDKNPPSPTGVDCTMLKTSDLATHLHRDDYAVEMRAEQARKPLGANPARRQLENLLGFHAYYPIGNTFGADLLADAIAPQPAVQRVVMLGCGDVRNVFETVHGWWRRQHNGSGRSTHTHHYHYFTFSFRARVFSPCISA